MYLKKKELSVQGEIRRHGVFFIENPFFSKCKTDKIIKNSYEVSRTYTSRHSHTNASKT